MQLEIARRGSKAILLTPGIDPDSKEAVRKALSYKDTGNAYLNKRFGQNKLATDFSALDTVTMTFPAGLMPRVVDVLRRFKHSITLSGGFVKPTPTRQYDFTRGYQEKAVYSLLEHYCGHVSVPTGGGKTHIIGALTYMLATETLVIVPSLEILDQVYERLEEVVHAHVSRLGGGDVLTDSPILVGTYQTLISRIEANDTFLMRFLDKVKLAIVDECHHMPCDSIRAIVDAARMLQWIYGVSATAYRKDGLEILMEGSVGPLRYEIDPPTLRAGGYIVGGNVTMMNVPQTGRLPAMHSKIDYHKVYKEYLTGSKVRRELEVTACHQLLTFGLKGICFVKHLEHGADIYKQLKVTWGTQVELLTGKTHKRDRARILSGLADGVYKLVIATIGKEGLDVPSINAIVFAEGGTDPSQQMGRGLRPYPGKDTLYVWDFYDNQHSMLLAQSKKRVDWYTKQGIYTVRMV